MKSGRLAVNVLIDLYNLKLESKATFDKSVKLSTPNTQCATDVLKAHIDHKHV